MNLDDLLRQLVERGGSDLHVQDGLPPRMRVHGELETVAEEHPDVSALVFPLMRERHRLAFEAEGQSDLAHTVEDAGRFRVNVFRHHRGVGAVLRLIPTRIPTLEELSIPEEAERFTRMRRGLVLVTGPTGSGKSSTLAALLGLINERDARHIVTIEDPVEFVHEDRLSTFTQREVGEDAATFADALRSAARQDPDLILVGEMRDRETIDLALTLAEMGNLVFSTLHTNSAARTLDRIVEVFSEEEQPQVRTMLANSLQGVLSQLLCRRADGMGRVPATELLFTNRAVEALIREGASHKVESLIQGGRSKGMHLLDDALFALAKDGIIDGEEAFHKASDKQRFARYVE